MKTLLMLSTMLLSTSIFAQQFTLGITKNVSDADSEIAENVKKAFELAGHEAVIKALPGVRSAAMLKSGELDGEVLRVASVIKEMEGVTPITVNILSVNIAAWGKPGTAYEGPASLANLTHATSKGVKFQQNFVAQAGAKHFEVLDVAAMVKMVASGRADITIYTSADANFVQLATAAGLEPLGDPIITIPSYSILHEKHAGFVEEIKAGYEQVFK